MYISIICPIYNEEKYIKKLITSILDQEFDKNQMEVLLIDGMSDDRTREIIAQYLGKCPFITLIDNPERTVSYALNIGIKHSVGSIIVRLDAHAQYPSNYLNQLVAKLNELDADNVGGTCRTLPIKNTPKCVAIAEALSCSFGIGNSYFRIGTTKVMEVDTVPFGCFRRDVFERIGFFDEDLIRNQDDEFNGRIIKNGGKIYLIPEVVVDYFARDTWCKVANMYYQYGLFKPLVNHKLGAPVTIRQFFPPAFVTGLTIGVILCLFSFTMRVLYLATLLLYIVIGVFHGFKVAAQHKKYVLLLTMPLTFFIIHISYGCGYIMGIYRLYLLGKSSHSVEISR